MIGFEYSRANNVADAIRQIAASPGAKFIAGGTNLVDLMKMHVERPAKLIDVKSTADGGLRVNISEAFPFGHANETVVITTNDPLYPSFTIPVKIVKRKAAAVQVTPESVDLSREEPSLLVQFRRKDGTPLTIANCVCDDNTLKLTWSKESGPAATLRVKLANDGEIKAGHVPTQDDLNRVWQEKLHDAFAVWRQHGKPAG